MEAAGGAVGDPGCGRGLGVPCLPGEGVRSEHWRPDMEPGSGGRGVGGTHGQTVPSWVRPESELWGAPPPPVQVCHQVTRSDVTTLARL